jgi:DNA modification methylase
MPGSLIQGNALSIPLKDKSVQLCCFSPPYFGLRKYKIPDVEFPNGWKGQMGLEPTIDQFLDNLMLVMMEVWRVLRDDGCVFVNIGDGYKAKSLCLVPQRFAIRCQEAGWIIRSEIILQKVNPIPESVNDRCSRSHEQVWMLTKQGSYFWDKEAVMEKTRRIAKVRWKESDLKKYSCDPRLEKQGTYKGWRKYCPTSAVKKRNIRSVWTLSTESHPETHFATFSSKLIDIIVRAGSSPGACEICGAPWRRVVEREEVTTNPETMEYSGKNYAEGGRSAGRRLLMQMSELRGLGRDHDVPYLKTRTVGWRKTCECDCAGTGRCVVLDPFVGIGTSVLVAEKHGRAGVGMDLSKEYLWDIALKKIRVPVQKRLELRF